MAKQKTDKNGNLICPLCDTGQNRLRGLGRVIRGKVYCLAHAKQLRGEPRGINAKN